MTLELEEKRCKACDAPIWFVVTEASALDPDTENKLIPIDVAPSPKGNVELVEIEWMFRPVARVLAKPPKVGTNMFDEGFYLSHFATCPKAGEFRR